MEIKPGENGYIEPTSEETGLTCSVKGGMKTSVLEDDYYCTREPDHKGPHAAHGMLNEVLTIWYTQ